MDGVPQFTDEQTGATQRYAAVTPPAGIDPRTAALVTDLIGRIADKWTMLMLDVLTARGWCGSPPWASRWVTSARRCGGWAWAAEGARQDFDQALQ